MHMLLFMAHNDALIQYNIYAHFVILYNNI